MTVGPSIHATAVLAGAHAVLIRGISGSGKSGLALAMLQSQALPFCRLIGDDRVHIEPVNGRLLVRPAPALAGLLEIRGIGIQRLPYEPVGVVGLVVDLAASEAERLPGAQTEDTSVRGIPLARLAVAPGTADILALVLARLGRLGAGYR